MKRARGSSDICTCGHTACKKVAQDSINVLGTQLTTLRGMIDANKGVEKIVRKMELAVRELSKRIDMLEEWKLEYARHLCEFVKREHINVRIKYDTPLKKSKFGGKIEEQINEKYVKKPKKSQK